MFKRDWNNAKPARKGEVNYSAEYTFVKQIYLLINHEPAHPGHSPSLKSKQWLQRKTQWNCRLIEGFKDFFLSVNACKKMSFLIM